MPRTASVLLSVCVLLACEMAPAPAPPPAEPARPPDTRPTFSYRRLSPIELLGVPATFPGGGRIALPMYRAVGGNGAQRYSIYPLLPGDLELVMRSGAPFIVGHPITAPVGSYFVTFTVHDSDDNTTDQDADFMKLEFVIAHYRPRVSN